MRTELFRDEASSHFSHLCERAKKWMTGTAPTKDWNVCSFSCRRQTYVRTSCIHPVNCGAQNDLIFFKGKKSIHLWICCESYCDIDRLGNHISGQERVTVVTFGTSALNEPRLPVEHGFPTGGHICKLCVCCENDTIIHAFRCITYCYFSTFRPGTRPQKVVWPFLHAVDPSSTTVNFWRPSTAV